MNTKQFLRAVALLVSMGVVATLQAQTPGTIPTDSIIRVNAAVEETDTVIILKRSVHPKTEPAAVVPGTAHRQPRPLGTYRTQEHNHMDEASTWFVEWRTAIGSTSRTSYRPYASDYTIREACLATGVQVAYVPQQWGGYMSYLWDFSLRDDFGWFSLGLVYRPRQSFHHMDFQLYGGLTAGEGMGLEYGVRLAPVTNMDFSWYSVSLGMMHTPYATCFSIGISLSLVDMWYLFPW